jgi:hypothetical protein
MPTQPQWFQQVASALATLCASSTLVVDRAGLEKLFGVSARTAVRLMGRFGGYQSGRNYLIGRGDLIRALEELQADDAFAYESRRRQRLVDDLETVRRELRAKAVKLPVTPEPAVESSLPRGIRVARPGVLEVEFTSAEDLLGRLYELVQLAARDLDSLDRSVAVREDTRNQRKTT